MKTFKTALAALALAIFTLPAWASTSPSNPVNLKTTVISNTEIVVQLTNLAEAKTFLSLRSLDGDAFYRKFIHKHNGFRTLLDLHKLPEGRYILSASQDGITKNQVIVVKEDGIKLSDVAEE